MNKEVIKTLTKARKLLETKGWTQGLFAKSAKGNAVSEHSRSAACFCAIGALSRACGKVRTCGVYYTATDYLDDVFDVAIIRSNDKGDTEKEHVLMSYDFAILMAKDDLKALEK